MGDFYQDMQGIATSLLTEFDQTRPDSPASANAVGGNGIFYRSIVPGDGPADDPGASQPRDFKLNAVARGVKWAYVQSGLAVAGQLQITMAVNPIITPNTNGFVIVDGKPYKVTQVVQKPASGTPVAYTLIFGNADQKLSRIAHV